MTARVTGKRRTARPYWNMAVEGRLGSPSFDAIRLRKLKQVLAYVFKHSGFHSARLRTLRIAPRRIRTLDDFRERVPLFTKEDHRKTQEESLARHGHAFG